MGKCSARDSNYAEVSYSKCPFVFDVRWSCGRVRLSVCSFPIDAVPIGMYTNHCIPVRAIAFETPTIPCLLSATGHWTSISGDLGSAKRAHPPQSLSTRYCARPICRQMHTRRPGHCRRRLYRDRVDRPGQHRFPHHSVPRIVHDASLLLSVQNKPARITHFSLISVENVWHLFGCLPL